MNAAQQVVAVAAPTSAMNDEATANRESPIPSPSAAQRRPPSYANALFDRSLFTRACRFAPGQSVWAPGHSRCVTTRFVGTR